MNDEERYADYLEGGTLDDTLDDGARAELDELRRLLASLQHVGRTTAGARRRHRRRDPGGGSASRLRRRRGVEGRGCVPSSRSPPLPRWCSPWRSAPCSSRATVTTTASRSRSPPRTSIPGASGSATVESTGSGLSISLTIEGLPPAEPGTFYQAWMRGDTGSVPIGTFHAREGDGPIELWSGVDVADYPTMTVTIQQEGAGPESSGIVVLRGEIPQP